MNRKKLITIGIILLICTTLSYKTCKKLKENTTTKHIKSTDLSNIKIDNMKIGDKVNWDNLEKYTYQSRYKYKELTIDLDKDDKIIYIFTYFRKINDINITININGKEDFDVISDITNLLGKNYTKEKENEQTTLSKNIYNDKKNKIILEIIYNKKDKKLKYVRLLDSNLKK